MPWLKKHYDRVLLICSALLLIGVSALLFLNSQGFAEAHDYAPTVAIVKNTAAKDNKIAPMPVGDVAKVSELASNPAQWTKGDLRLFVSHIVIEKDGNLQFIDEKTMVHPPIPNAWVQRYELPINDTDLLTQDTDKDGFSTLDEWIGVEPAVPTSVQDRKSTDPIDPKSHPPYFTKLFLNRVDRPKLEITFESVPGPGSFTFNTGAGSSSQILEMGSIISEERPNQAPRKRFKIIGYKEKKEKHPTLEGMDVDVSEVMLLNEETKTNHVLKVGQTMDSPDSYAVFDYLWDNTNFTVKQGTEFQLKPEGTQYKLIDIGEDKAVINDVKTGTSLEIRKRSSQP